METQEIRQLIDAADNVDFAPFGHGVPEARIARAEAELGLVFPPTYRWWLSQYGGGEIDGKEIYSVYDIDNVEGGGDIVYMWKVNRADNAAEPDQLFISEPGNDESFYFALDECDSNGEYPVYVFDYVANEHKKYARDFFEFLEKQIGPV